MRLLMRFLKWETAWGLRHGWPVLLRLPARFRQTPRSQDPRWMTVKEGGTHHETNCESGKQGRPTNQTKWEPKPNQTLASLTHSFPNHLILTHSPSLLSSPPIHTSLLLLSIVPFFFSVPCCCDNDCCCCYWWRWWCALFWLLSEEGEMEGEMETDKELPQEKPQEGLFSYLLCGCFVWVFLLWCTKKVLKWEFGVVGLKERNTTTRKTKKKTKKQKKNKGEEVGEEKPHKKKKAREKEEKKTPIWGRRFYVTRGLRGNVSFDERNGCVFMSVVSRDWP